MPVLTNELAETVEFSPFIIRSSSDLEAPILVALFDYWDRLRGHRFAPGRKEIRPADIPTLLPHLLIFELLDADHRCKVRLAGSLISRYFDPGLTGTILDDRNDNLAERRNLAAMRRVARERVPLGCAWDVENLPDLTFRSSEVIWLPLSSDGVTVDQIISSFWLTPKQRSVPVGFNL